MKYVLIYLAAIVIANLVAATFGPAATILDAFVFIALDLTARDSLHEAWQHDKLWLKMGMLIGTGSALSYLINRDAGPIALASFVAFMAANAVDTVIYQLLHKTPWAVKVNGSNAVSALVDSLVFPTLAFGSFLPLIVLGQWLAKVLGGVIWSVILNRHMPTEPTQWRSQTPRDAGKEGK